MELSKDLKKALLISASALMTLSVGASFASNEANASHVHHHARIHRYVRKHVRKHARRHMRARRHKHSYRMASYRHGALPLSGLNFAESYMGRKHSEYSMKNRNAGARAIARGSHRKAKTDASAFIWGVLKHESYHVNSKPWSTKNMLKQDGGTLKRISAKHARPGDILIKRNGDYAHTAILLQSYHGKRTHILGMGGAENDVNISTVGEAFGGHTHHLVFAQP